MTPEEQAEFLATQWRSVGQLEAAGELDPLILSSLGVLFTKVQLGIPCRRGPFVEQEIQKINNAIWEYQKVHN